ncbi:MAG: protein translocase subunit SecD, partial [Alphaproteobacteria bacterium]|nr:protein translocase subunit SecD [Alphaproteobacteria bacterium]
MLQFPAWKKGLIAVIALLGALYAAPNVTGPWSPWADYPTWMPGKALSLGLDLRGGAHLLVQVRTDDVVHERLGSTADALRVQMREKRVRASSFNVDNAGLSVSFTIRDAAGADKTLEAIDEAAPGYDVTRTGDTRFSLVLPETEVLAINQRTMAQSLEVVTRRVNALGLTEPTIQRQGLDRILIQVPGLADTKELKSILNAQARLTFHLVDFDQQAQAIQRGRAPSGYQLLPSIEESAPGVPARQYLVSRQAFVSGENLTNAQATFQDGRPVVSFTFDSIGAQRFGRVTQENVGGFLAAVLDGKVVSAPRIQSPILGGSGVITGNFSLAEAQETSLLLRAG